MAAYLVSEALGWNIVPRTWLRDGPFGEGMVQLWQETDPEQSAVDLVPADAVPDTGWKEALQSEGESGRIVALVHEDTPALRRWRCSTLWSTMRTARVTMAWRWVTGTSSGWTTG